MLARIEQNRGDTQNMNLEWFVKVYLELISFISIWKPEVYIGFTGTPSQSSLQLFRGPDGLGTPVHCYPLGRAEQEGHGGRSKVDVNFFQLPRCWMIKRKNLMDLGFLGKFLNSNYIGRILPALKIRVTYRVNCQPQFVSRSRRHRDTPFNYTNLCG